MKKLATVIAALTIALIFAPATPAFACPNGEGKHQEKTAEKKAEDKAKTDTAKKAEPKKEAPKKEAPKTADTGKVSAK